MRGEVGGDNFEPSVQPWRHLVPQPIRGKLNPRRARALSWPKNHWQWREH